MTAGAAKDYSTLLSATPAPQHGFQGSYDHSPLVCCNKQPMLNAWPAQVHPFLMPEALPHQSCTGKQLCCVHPAHVSLKTGIPTVPIPTWRLRGSSSCHSKGQAKTLCKHRPILDLVTKIQLSGLSLACFFLVRISTHPEGFWAWLGN